MASPGPGNPSAAAKHMRMLLPFSHKSLRIPTSSPRTSAPRRATSSSGSARVRPCASRWAGTATARSCGAGGRSSWPRAASAPGGSSCSGTVKAFDDSCCLRELPAQAPAATTSSNGASHKPRFINVLPQDSMGKMQIPAVSVQSYIPKEHLNSHRAVVYGPLGKVGQIEVKMSRSGVFFAGGWSLLLAFHGITNAICLLLRYEGFLVFTLKVFESNGLQRDSKHNGTRFQQNEPNMVTERKHKTPSASTQKCNSKNSWLGSERQKKAKISKTYLGKESFPRRSFYRIEPPSRIKKQINTNLLKDRLALAKTFCDAIGLRESRMITLKTSMDSDSSWQVHGSPYKNGSYILSGGVRGGFARTHSGKATFAPSILLQPHCGMLLSSVIMKR